MSSITDTIKSIRFNRVSSALRKDFRQSLDYIEQMIRPQPAPGARLPGCHGVQTEFMPKAQLGIHVVVPDSTWERRGAVYAGV